MEADLSPDLAIGSFSDRGPWVVDPEAMTWRADVDRKRAQARAEFPRWLDPGTFPPVSRVGLVVGRVGAAVAGWYAIDRRGGREAGRRGLSRRLRIAFGKLGPTYIKLGQIISGGEGLFPPELVSEFKALRDRVPAEPFDVVRRVVEMDLGRSLDDVFERFDRVPIAAASIAQVHAAKLRTGEEVVVKVQRPQVARLVREDIRAMSWLAPRLIGRIPVAALANPPALVELFAETIVEELDFCLEAQNMLDIAHVLAETNQRATIVPRPHPTLVTRRVLVMERLDGIPWDDVDAMKQAGVDTEAVLHAGLVSFMEGAMLFGVFHGDLHGGNLMVRPDGRTVLMDFGITGRLDETKRMAFLMLLVSATSGDTMGQLRALRDLGAFPPDTDLSAVFKDLGLDRSIDPTMLSADELVHELQDLTKKLLEYGARVPKELMLFVKNMMFLDGAIARLAPDLDILGEIQLVHTEIAARHGVRLANELGIDPALTAEFDMNAVKAAMGVPDVEKLTYREVQERRDVIRQRLEEKRKRAVASTLMTTYPIEEVEAAFRKYWELGAVAEDWDAWCDECFTEDVKYVEHILGSHQGREAVRAWIKPTMAEYGGIYTAYEWHMAGPDGRVVVYMQNRRDHPDASQPPIDFPGMTVLQYAGDGKFSFEEDFWSLPEGIETAKRSFALYRDLDPEFPKKRSRRDWGNGPEWTQGASTYAESRGATRARGVMPELPQMQALAERIEEWLLGSTFEGYVPLGFSGLKTAVPSPDDLIGRTLTGVGRRAKYVLLEFDGEPARRVVFHLSQAGRVDFEQPPKTTKPKGSVVRWKFSDDSSSDQKAVLLREWGTERKAGWWVLGPGDEGPLATLGPEATSDEFAQWLRTADDGRRVHTILRDQHTVAGVGRGYADDALHRAKLSPYVSLKSLKPDERERLLDAIVVTLADGLERERTRTGGLSSNKLGEHFTVHGKAGLPCPECNSDLKRVSYESHEVVYCPQCQTGGKVLADRRLSRLVK